NRALRPGVWRARDRVQVARREALEAERVQQARVVAEEDVGDLASHADHLVPVVRVEDAVDIRSEVVEDRKVVRREGAYSSGARNLVQGPASLETRHGVREPGAEEIG